MEPYNTTPPGRDPKLWELARRRASFRGHLLTYLVMVPVFWAIWYFTGGPNFNQFLPWPIWPTLGWGIGVLFHYLGAFVFPKSNSVEREYEKLLSDRDKH